ncbi:MAG: PspA/IM30 family protein [Streptosporangiaceae bacterium]
MGYQLRMSGEIHDWLQNLRRTDPPRAGLVAEALTALAAGGASLGPPLVRPADPDQVTAAEPEADPRARLDVAYQDQLELLAPLRRRVADAATLAKQFSRQIGDLGSLRLQLAEQRQEALAAGETSRAETVAQAIDDVDSQVAMLRERLPQVTAAEQALTRHSYQQQVRAEELRVRKETLKARYTAAEAEVMVAHAAAALDAEPAGTAATAQAKLRGITEEIDRELAQAGRPAAGPGPARWSAALLELRPGVPPGADPGGAETSILFAVQPPGTALLMAVLDGGDAIRERRDDAVAAAQEALQQAQPGQDPELAGHSYRDAASVLAAFGPQAG